MASPNDSKAKTSEINPGEAVLSIPQSDIFVDYDWNVRSKSAIMSDSSNAVQDTTIKGEHVGEGAGLPGLCLDLHQTGQDTACVVRKVEGGTSLGGKKTDKPFELVCGFRRYTAIDLLNSGKAESFGGKADSKESKELVELLAAAKKAKKQVVPNTPDGTVRAVIRALSPQEARILNGKENTQRDDLSTQDMVRYISILQSSHKMNQVAIAGALGIGQPYVSRLAKIATLPKAVLAHWRGEAKLPGLPADAVQERLTSRQLTELADATKGQPDNEVTERYIQLVCPPPPAEGGDTASDPIAKKIVEYAQIMGGLVRNGLFSVDKLDWARVIGPKKDGYLIGTGKIDATKRGEYWDLMDKEFTKALSDKPEKAEKKSQKDKDDAAAN